MNKILFLLCLYISSVTIASDTIKVMVIDTGINAKDHIEISQHIKEDLNGIDYYDPHGHGTSIAGLVLKDVCSQVELISCRYYSLGDNMNLSNICLKEALKKNVDFVNYSSSGQDPNLQEYKLMKQLSDKGVKIVVAAGNSTNDEDTGQFIPSKDLTPNFPCSGAFPACYLLENEIIVSNISFTGFRSKTSNWAKLISNYAVEQGENVPILSKPGSTKSMSGTSQAAAIHMNRLLKLKCIEFLQK